MGRTYATATIIGDADTREYEFLIDTGATHVGLPQNEMEELGLAPIPNGVISVRTANGIIEQKSYWALGQIDGRGFVTVVTQAPIPLIGYHLLQTMRYRVNPVTESLERLPEDEFGPPYLLIGGFQID